MKNDALEGINTKLILVERVTKLKLRYFGDMAKKIDRWQRNILINNLLEKRPRGRARTRLMDGDVKPLGGKIPQAILSGQRQIHWRWKTWRAMAALNTEQPL